MSLESSARVRLTLHNEPLPLKAPFRISGYTFDAMPATIVTLRDGDLEGRGEGAGVYYLDDHPEKMLATLEAMRDTIESGVTRTQLRSLLPPGGARNALDCALWELESLRAGIPVWQLAGIAAPQPRVTTFTLPADDPAEILRRLSGFPTLAALKLKLDGDLAADPERVRVVRKARPDVWLGVDANQGYGADDLDALAAMLVGQNVSLLEQPVKRGAEALLEGWRSPVTVAADESILDLAELEARHHLFQVLNIKLDKCGGLTEALMMVERGRQLGLQIMVGNMAGATLSAAPAFILAQLCDIVDLDGPWFVADDPLAESLYEDGKIMVPEHLWGAG